MPDGFRSSVVEPASDERGAGEAIDGIRRGSPADFWKMAEASDNTLVIGTR
jgi:tRNA 2-thiouridine synthesizing protein D